MVRRRRKALWLVALVALVALAALAGCGDSDPARIDAVVTASGLPERIERLELHVSVAGAVGTERVFSAGATYRDGALEPWTTSVEPVSAEDEGRTLYVFRAVGLRAGVEYVRVQSRLVFVPGTRMVLPLRLEAECVGVTCSGEQTCARGSCRDDFLDSCSLIASKRPPSCVHGMDAGRDAGASDATVDSPFVPNDAGGRDAPSTDAGADTADTADTGSMDEGHEDTGSMDAGNEDTGSMDDGGADAGMDAVTTRVDAGCTARGRCLIAGVCRTAGEIDPTNACRACDPSRSSTDWSPRTGQTCDDGMFCTSGDTCDELARCTGVARTCPPASGCQQAVCDEAVDRCGIAIQAGRCLIGAPLAACYAAGDRNPANPCEACTPSASQTAWTPIADGTSCDDGMFCTINDACSAGVCRGLARVCPGMVGGCRDGACDEAADLCTTAIRSGSCELGAGPLRACYAAGDRRPSYPCQECNPTVSQTDWTNRPDGSTCGMLMPGHCCSGTCTETLCL